MPLHTRVAAASAMLFGLGLGTACGPDLTRRDGRLTVEVSDVPSDAARVNLLLRQGEARFERDVAPSSGGASFLVQSVPVGEIEVEVLATGSAQGNIRAVETLRIVEEDNLLRLSLADASSELTPVRRTIQAVLRPMSTGDEQLLLRGESSGWTELLEAARTAFGTGPSRLVLESATASLPDRVDELSFDELWEETVLLALEAGASPEPLGTARVASTALLLDITPVNGALDPVTPGIIDGSLVVALLRGEGEGFSGTVDVELRLTVRAMP